MKDRSQVTTDTAQRLCAKTTNLPDRSLKQLWCLLRLVPTDWLQVERTNWTAAPFVKLLKLVVSSVFLVDDAMTPSAPRGSIFTQSTQ